MQPDRTPSAAQTCDQPMRGLYGATTICARPAGHAGKHDPLWNHEDWSWRNVPAKPLAQTSAGICGMHGCFVGVSCPKCVTQPKVTR